MNDFELKPTYFTLVGHHPFHDLLAEHPMDHIERFEDLVTSIKLNAVSEDYFSASCLHTLLLELQLIGSRTCNQDH